MTVFSSKYLRTLSPSTVLDESNSNKAKEAALAVAEEDVLAVHPSGSIAKMKSTVSKVHVSRKELHVSKLALPRVAVGGLLKKSDSL